jgi:hypothetical protein
MDTINTLLSAFYITNKKYDAVYEFNNTEETNDNTIIEYYNFIIKNNGYNKTKIDKFIENVIIPFDIYSKTKGCDLSLVECVNTLNYLLSRKEIINSINNITSINSKNFKEIIETLFFKIIVIHLELFNVTEDIIKKHTINAKMCEYSIKYSHVLLSGQFRNIYNNYYKSLLYRCLNSSAINGCLISWLTFAKLSPEMVNDDYYPKINQTTDIYKKINIAYIKDTELFEKELELFNKYIHFNKKD